MKLPDRLGSRWLIQHAHVIWSSNIQSWMCARESWIEGFVLGTVWGLVRYSPVRDAELDVERSRALCLAIGTI
jgi:hypothetical protein